MTAQTHKRIELIIERMALKRASRVLEGSGLSGFTVISAMAGFGRGRHWSRDTDLSNAQDMVVVIAIAPAAIAERALADIRRLLGDHIGVVSVSDTEVLRPERFEARTGERTDGADTPH